MEKFARYTVRIIGQICLLPTIWLVIWLASGAFGWMFSASKEASIIAVFVTMALCGMNSVSCSLDDVAKAIKEARKDAAQKSSGEE